MLFKIYGKISKYNVLDGYEKEPLLCRSLMIRSGQMSQKIYIQLETGQNSNYHSQLLERWHCIPFEKKIIGEAYLDEIIHSYFRKVLEHL